MASTTKQLEGCCMNVVCKGELRSSSSSSRGWELRSGGFANLCDKCGFAYEQLLFCDTFHSKESGWRECSSCGKRLHCGCIASKSFLQLLDNGGVECIGCIKSSECSAIAGDEKPIGLGTSVMDNVAELRSTFLENRMDGGGLDMGMTAPIGNSMHFIEKKTVLPSQRNDTNGSVCQIKREQGVPPMGEVGCPSFSNLSQPSVGPYQFKLRDSRKEMMGVINSPESLSHTCLRMNLGSPTGETNLALPLSGAFAEGRDLSKMPSPLQQGQRSRHLLPKPSKLGPGTVPETKDILPQIRVARPPVEGRGKSQLLPRYWPRITEQELQQISGDSNSTIVPLFEKVLSASDAGRIGRLVLPKACAEAYFPPISQPEGLPLRIQDAKGKDWVFQFRFWPNNNSRMYVLEGVTPCIQAMQLQAGDTVTFSRIDPERKLVMGFRKASNSVVNLQDMQTSAIANGALANTSFFSGVIENLPIISGYSGLLQSLKGSTDSHLNALSEHIHSADGDSSWRKSEKLGRRPNEGLQLQQLLVPEKKRSRNIGSKSKRLLIDSEAALELKLTWEEAQDLLRPPPCAKPSIVMVEDHVFEEYEEPPVFGKKTIFTSGSSGGQDQWAQCDSCYKWRRLPVDALLPPKWTCAENVWDANRCMCAAPDELSQKEIENLLRLNMDLKKRKIASTDKVVLQESEPSGLDTLATAAVLGENGVDSGTPSVATTTKHPRHRPGCTCIVCIQPPSGKGPKHKPTCTCNVCMTVKRRFKTLMMRKKKRQSEKEAEIAQKKYHMEGLKDEIEVESSSRCMLSPLEAYENEAWFNGNEAESSSHDRNIQMEKELESSKGHIDLNTDPGREEDALGGAGGSERVSMMSLLQVASLPLDTYLKQNGLRSLIRDNQTNSSNSNPPPEATEGRNSEEIPPIDEGNDLTTTAVQDQEDLTIAVQEQESEVEEGNRVHEPPQSDDPV